MIQNLHRAKRFLALLCVLLASLCILTPAFAQLDYDTYPIYQGGNIVGVIYVPQRGPDTSVYAEYWVMSNRYVYPSERIRSQLRSCPPPATTTPHSRTSLLRCPGETDSTM